MRSVMLGLGAVATVSAIAPILLPLPKPVATGSLVLSVATGLGMVALAKQYERVERIHAAQFETGMQWLRQDMALQRSTQAHAQTALSKMELLLEAQSLPLELQPVFLAEFGLAPLQQAQRQAVTTTAVEVPQRAERSIAHAPTYAPPQAQSFQVLDVEDIASTYAVSTQSPGTIRNVLVPAEPGVGKSTLICAVIHALNNVHQGNVDFNVLAGKMPDPANDPGYCGLESSDNDYLFSGDYTNTRKVHSRLKRLTDLCMQPSQAWPTVIIQDEMNNTMDAMLLGDKKTFEDIKALNDMRLTQGRSRRVVDFITSHSRLVQDIHYNRSKQQAFDFIIPGRYPNAMNSIAAALSDKQLVKDDVQREQLNQLFLQFLDSPSNGVIALTNLGGQWRLVQLPDYRQYEKPIQRGILNQGSEELAEELEEDVWGESPKEEPDNQRFFEMLIVELREVNAFSKPKQEAIALIATIAEKFFIKHGRPADRDGAMNVAQYLWDLKENGSLPS